jgi:hypothetical protein
MRLLKLRLAVAFFRQPHDHRKIFSALSVADFAAAVAAHTELLSMTHRDAGSGACELGSFALQT